jgi:acetyl esterase/lipase
VIDFNLATAQSQRSPGKLPPRFADSVELHADLPYADTDNPRQRLDLLVPKAKSDKPLPVVAFVHGGAWQAGDKQQGRQQVLPLVASGEYAVVSLGYRLSDEAQWPSQIHDCKAAIRWIKANAEKYNLDPDKIGVWGPSAGGHLVAVLGTSAGVEAMDGELGPHTDQSTDVACVVDYFGPTDFLAMSKPSKTGAALDHNASMSPESRLIGGAIQENKEKVAAANPITYVTSNDPPFLIVHGSADPVVPFNQSQLLRDALSGANVTNTLITVEGGGHGQGFPPKTLEITRRFFDHHLRGEESEWQDETVEAVENSNAAPRGAARQRLRQRNSQGSN